ncbi:MAG: asparagine synthase (glutamine-hydrolyzing) [bacterium]|nr:asparagine synthase (glutamine-hydrolyzing) [bacterium]
MCGIYGMVALDGEALHCPELLEPMSRSLHHRGPDGRGVVRDRRAAMGTERLRIVDLREQADQPFADPRSRCWLVCNGEIYNAAELRRRYPDYPYRSHSDVETILPLYLDKGAEGLSELDGMFGLALWDLTEETLILARDRAGEKPLFYRRVGGELWFASEVQALLVGPGISRELDDTAIFQFLALGYVLEPRTAFREIRKVGAGTIVRHTSHGADVSHYWDPGAGTEDSGDLRESTARLAELLRAAVRKQAAAEVPVGIFVSGGMDSSLLTVLAAQEDRTLPLHTYAARFSEPSYDESQWATECARRSGTVHHEVVIDEHSMLQALEAVTDNLAEPLADPAILPTYLLARQAREDVKVVLSGEGADELFGGYPTYLGHKLIPCLEAVPPLRRLLHSLADRLPASRGKVTFEFLLKRFLADADKPLIERHLSWFGTGAEGMLAANGQPTRGMEELAMTPLQPNGAGNAMLLDYRTYLRDNLLVKVDRATMLNSVEARAPFLDRDLSAFSLALPEHLKVRGLTTKWLLKKVAREWLPKPVVHRRKRGLSVPVASWIDAGLRSEVDRLLAAERLRRQELLDPEPVQLLLSEHRSGKVNHARALWALVVFQYWLERWAPERAG